SRSSAIDHFPEVLADGWPRAGVIPKRLCCEKDLFQWLLVPHGDNDSSLKPIARARSSLKAMVLPGMLIRRTLMDLSASGPSTDNRMATSSPLGAGHVRSGNLVELRPFN